MELLLVIFKWKYIFMCACLCVKSNDLLAAPTSDNSQYLTVSLILRWAKIKLNADITSWIVYESVYSVVTTITITSSIGLQYAVEFHEVKALVMC